MPVCHKRKLAFIHVPRTGGISITRALDLEAGPRHAPASWYRENFPDYFCFATYRPYMDRIKSAYGYGIPDILEYNGTYDELVNSTWAKREENRGVLFKPTEFFLDVPVDHIIQFSNLEVDLNKMLKMLGLDTVKLDKTNSFRSAVIAA